MLLKSQVRPCLCKRLSQFCALALCVTLLAACSTNPATGKSQFAAFMSPQEELKTGAQEHQKIVAEYGLYDNPALQAYVSGIGARVTQKTERPDVTYKFFIIDSPIVNAFALPGGYIYVSRGLLALANSEAELAGVLGHEAGHITARHAAERYSHGVVTSLGGSILSAVLGSPAASQAIGVGTNLYMTGYSRGQENEADGLGIRYMGQGGYDPSALSSFLQSLNADSELSQRLNGGKAPPAYLSTHPPTPERVAKTSQAAQNQQVNNAVNGQDVYFKQIDGMIYGDSAAQGFVRGQTFYHPELGFQITAPADYRIINQPTEIVIKSTGSDALMIFDFAANNQSTSPVNYLTNYWMKDKPLDNIDNITINGMQAATGSFEGSVNNKPMTIRLIAIDWGQGRYARFQIAVPKGLSAPELDAIKTASYSFKRLSAAEKQRLKPNQIKIITAKQGDTVESLARRQAFDKFQLEYFRLLNGMGAGQGVIPGHQYKLVVAP